MTINAVNLSLRLPSSESDFTDFKQCFLVSTKPGNQHEMNNRAAETTSYSTLQNNRNISKTSERGQTSKPHFIPQTNSNPQRIPVDSTAHTSMSEMDYQHQTASLKKSQKDTFLGNQKSFVSKNKRSTSTWTIEEHLHSH